LAADDDELEVDDEDGASLKGIPEKGAGTEEDAEELDEDADECTIIGGNCDGRGGAEAIVAGNDEDAVDEDIDPGLAEKSGLFDMRTLYRDASAISADDDNPAGA
jgi:hypothetical protein